MTDEEVEAWEEGTCPDDSAMNGRVGIWTEYNDATARASSYGLLLHAGEGRNMSNVTLPVTHDPNFLSLEAKCSKTFENQ